MDEEGFSEGGEESGGKTGGDYNNDTFEFRVKKEVSVFDNCINSSSTEKKKKETAIAK